MPVAQPRVGPARPSRHLGLSARRLDCIPRREQGIEVVPSDLHRWPIDELRRLASFVSRQQIDVIHTPAGRIFSASSFAGSGRAQRGDRSQSSHPVALDVQRPGDRHIRGYAAIPAEVESVPAGRIETIHNFIDYRRLAAVPANARSQVRRSLGIAANSPAGGRHGANHSAEGIDTPGPRTAEDCGGAPNVRLSCER